jgi:hemolysin D
MMQSITSSSKVSRLEQFTARLHDPLRLISQHEPDDKRRIVLGSAIVLVLTMMLWAMFGQLDIVVSADGKLVPKTLIKIVQPAEAGVVNALLVNEGDFVRAGQVLARLDDTLALADKKSILNELNHQRMQERRIVAERNNTLMLPESNDAPDLFAQVQNQYQVHRRAYLDSVEQEQSLLSKVQNEYRSAVKIKEKIAQSLPVYERSAEAYVALEKKGFFSPLASADKQREALEKSHDLAAQQAIVASLHDTMVAQKKRLSQIESHYFSDLERELAGVRERIGHLQPTFDKSIYREGLMALTAPQDGIVKSLATTVGAVVQPGAVVMTLVPKDEQLFADVSINNEDVGFVQIGQKVHIKLSAYPFQKYGMLTGTIQHISADANDSTPQSERDPSLRQLAYKARIALDDQHLQNPQGVDFPLTAGMQVVSEINQGKRTILDYLLSPVKKVVQEAARER